MAGRQADSLLFKAVFDEFSKIYEKTVQTVERLQLIFGLMGVFGSFLGLSTMIYSRKMSTASFTYHKVLTASSLVSCINYLLFKMCTDVFSLKPFTYNHRILAIYAGTMSRAVGSTCGYVGLYMSFFVALDRCVALVIPLRYSKLNQVKLSRSLILISIILSATLHSWATWLETHVFTILGPKNQTLYTYKTSTHVPPDLIRIKNVYNSIVRLPYPFILAILTGISIWLFAKKQAEAAVQEKLTSRRSIKKALQRDRSLFLLMICVVILAFIHVTPREIKRILELFFPKEKMMKNTLDGSLPLEYRLKCFRMLLYGIKLLTVICNLCTTIDRGLLFYLYFALNRTFREAVIDFLRMVFCCEHPNRDFTSTFSSATGTKYSSYDTVALDQSSIGALRSRTSTMTLALSPRSRASTTVNSPKSPRARASTITVSVKALHSFNDTNIVESSLKIKKTSTSSYTKDANPETIRIKKTSVSSYVDANPGSYGSFATESRVLLEKNDELSASWESVHL